MKESFDGHIFKRDFGTFIPNLIEIKIITDGSKIYLKKRKIIFTAQGEGEVGMKKRRYKTKHCRDSHWMTKHLYLRGGLVVGRGVEDTAPSAEV